MEPSTTHLKADHTHTLDSPAKMALLILCCQGGNILVDPVSMNESPKMAVKCCEDAVKNASSCPCFNRWNGVPAKPPARMLRLDAPLVRCRHPCLAELSRQIRHAVCASGAIVSERPTETANRTYEICWEPFLSLQVMAAQVALGTRIVRSVQSGTAWGFRKRPGVPDLRPVGQSPGAMVP